LRDLQRKAATLRKYQSDRAALVLARRKKKEQIFQHRSARAIALEQSLRSTIVEFQISVKYHQGTHSPELEAPIKKEMEWRTSQVPRAALIGKSFSPFGLLDAICNENHDAFLSICDEDGSPVLSPQDVVCGWSCAQTALSLLIGARSSASKRARLIAFSGRRRWKLISALLFPPSTNRGGKNKATRRGLGSGASILHGFGNAG
jgi:hypothetical protein